MSRYRGKRPLWQKILLVLVLAGILVFAALAAAVGWGAYHQVYAQPQAVVVLGCQVRQDGPSVLLRDRLETALEYLTEHPELPVVVSGGQGEDEPVSEAQCMYDYLVEHGVEAERIHLEDQSHNTSQNLTFTRAVLEGMGLDVKEDNVLIVSSGFHLTRIRMLAGRYGYQQVSTLAAPVSHLPSAVKMFFREPLALAKSFIFD